MGDEQEHARLTFHPLSANLAAFQSLRASDIRVPHQRQQFDLLLGITRVRPANARTGARAFTAHRTLIYGAPSLPYLTAHHRVGWRSERHSPAHGLQGEHNTGMSGVRGFVGVTDNSWYRLLADRPELLGEVNFWRPGGGGFRALQSGEPFFFKTHAPVI